MSSREEGKRAGSGLSFRVFGARTGMLAKKFRLPIKRNLFSGQKFLRGDYFVFKKRDSGLPWSRFGVIVSGKAVKGAVQRNRLRRMVFDFVQKRNLQLIPGTDFLLVAGPLSAAAGKEKIEKELEKFLIR